MEVTVHCAYCLIPITGEQIKRCGSCNRRPYCSRECQVSDWKTAKGHPLQQNGQGHKNWCKIPSGEEGLDWKIAPVEGKGLGIIALREIPPLFRIMVDACQLSSGSHPMTKELMPINGTLEDKWKLNSLGCDSHDDDVEQVLSLQLSRANHRCNPNASHIYDSGMKVKILFAERTISPGEEICISYAGFDDVAKKSNSQEIRTHLNKVWGINCPEDCSCRSPQALKSVEKGKELDSRIFALASNPSKTELALKCVDSLLEHYSANPECSTINETRTLYDGFQIAVMKKKTLPRAQKYIDKLVELQEALFHPNSSRSVEYKSWKDDLSKHRNYLIHAMQ